MSHKKSKVKEKDRTNNLAEKLDHFPTEETRALSNETAVNIQPHSLADNVEDELTAKIEAGYSRIFDNWDESEFESNDYVIEVETDSLESNIGYSSLLRQMHNAYIRRFAFYRSEAGGALSREEARARAFHPAANKDEAKKLFSNLMSRSVDSLNFIDLMELQEQAPRAAEKFWERIKQEARAEFESGHLSANIAFPVGYMKQPWNIARYLAVRDSFIDEWNPRGGIELSMIDIMAQAYFQWQFWIEQTVRRSQTPERDEHPQYTEWKRHQAEEIGESWTDGHWLRPYASEVRAIEHAAQMADRFNRIFLRNLRQLRDLRRYSPVTINNPNQVNIAAEGGQQINLTSD